MTRDQLVEVLKAGADLHQSEAMEFNDFDLDATSTEYLLTACLLRAALRTHGTAKAEALCKKVVNVLTSSASVAVRKGFGKQRLDVLIGEYLTPLALVEVKIGVRSARKLTSDADKILTTIDSLDKVRTPVLGAVVYEVHVPGSGRIATTAQFDAKMTKLAGKIQSELNAHLRTAWPSVSATHVELKRDTSEAQVEAGCIEADGSSTYIFAAIFEQSRAGEARSEGDQAVE